MWYLSHKQPMHADFKVTSETLEAFNSFCDEEVFWHPKALKDDFIFDIEKDIFCTQPLSPENHSFISFVLSYFKDNKMILNPNGLKDFFDIRSASNPIHLLLMANNHRHLTVKLACQFLNHIHPSAPRNAWKNYLADNQTVFSDTYFVSEAYRDKLEQKKIMLRDYVLHKEAIKSGLSNENIYTLYIPALLKTNLILNKDEKNKLLIKEFFSQNILNPLMIMPSENPPQTLFEHAMTRPRNNVLWWLQDMLVSYENSFVFDKMIDYFGQQLTSGFYLEHFPNEYHNYKKILEGMKKTAFKQKIEQSLEMKKQEKLIKI